MAEEQTKPSSPALAVVVADHFNCLCQNGLQRQEALELTAAYQSELLDPQRNNPDGEEVG